MSGAVISRVPFSALNAMRVRRKLRNGTGQKKLDILRRLVRQYVLCNLPKQAETRVEQSFNERLFAEVFDYRTLLSHDGIPYHLQPKKVTGMRHYDDFSLGEFVDGTEPSIVSAELKSPDADLDAPQTGRANRVTPVAQALTAAREHGAAWAIVSNYRKLRLYDMKEPTAPLVEADLHEVRTLNSLALLCAHFDRRALIRTGATEAEMTIALKPDHPSLPVPPEVNRYRVVVRFAPKVASEIPLYRIETAIREIARTPGARGYFVVKSSWHDDPDRVPCTLEDGYLSIDSMDTIPNQRWRLGVNVEGEIQGSLSYEFRFIRERGIDATTLRERMATLVRFVGSLAATLPYADPAGLLTTELLDVKDATLQEWIGTGGFTPGTCKSDNISGADFPVPNPKSISTLADDCLRDLTIYFRTKDGEGFQYQPRQPT